MVAPLAAGIATALRVAAAGEEVTIGSQLRYAFFGTEFEFPEGQAEITIPVSSEAIRSITYHAAGIITVVFARDGSSYDYPGTEEEFIAFALAPSKGRWFNEHLREPQIKTS